MKTEDKSWGLVLVPLVPYFVVFGAWVAFAYLAPCSCMGGCSPTNTPNRCIRNPIP